MGFVRPHSGVVPTCSRPEAEVQDEGMGRLLFGQRWSFAKHGKYIRYGLLTG
jgi:hypothetical protein